MSRFTAEQQRAHLEGVAKKNLTINTIGSTPKNVKSTVIVDVSVTNANVNFDGCIVLGSITNDGKLRGTVYLAPGASVSGQGNTRECTFVRLETWAEAIQKAVELGIASPMI